MPGIKWWNCLPLVLAALVIRVACSRMPKLPFYQRYQLLSRQIQHQYLTDPAFGPLIDCLIHKSISVFSEDWIIFGMWISVSRMELSRQDSLTHITSNSNSFTSLDSISSNLRYDCVSVSIDMRLRAFMWHKLRVFPGPWGPVFGWTSPQSIRSNKTQILMFHSPDGLDFVILHLWQLDLAPQEALSHIPIRALYCSRSIRAGGI